MDVREKLVELLKKAKAKEQYDFLFCDIDTAIDMPHGAEYYADYMIANGVTVQEDVTELLGKGLDNIYWRIYGANKEFNERMAGYNPSAFCAGFEYAIQLAKGLLTQLPQPPKGEQ